MVWLLESATEQVTAAFGSSRNKRKLSLYKRIDWIQVTAEQPYVGSSVKRTRLFYTGIQLALIFISASASTCSKNYTFMVRSMSKVHIVTAFVCLFESGVVVMWVYKWFLCVYIVYTYSPRGWDQRNSDTICFKRMYNTVKMPPQTQNVLCLVYRGVEMIHHFMVFQVLCNQTKCHKTLQHICQLYRLSGMELWLVGPYITEVSWQPILPI